MSIRLSCLKALFISSRIDALLVTNEVNIRYLTGFPAAEAWLLVTPKKAFYITDFRYVLEARKGVGDAEVIQYTDSLYKTTVDLARDQKVKVLGLDERHISAHAIRRLKTLAAGKPVLRSADSLVEVLRSIKDKGELALIRKALKINTQAYRFIEPFIKPGVREMDLLSHFEDFIREKKAAFAFPPIIASGPNAAFPHARVSGRKLRRRESLLIDFGVRINGYNSDLTRMFFLGTMARSLRENLSLIRGAQEEAFRIIRPGIKARAVDAAARGFLDRHGLAGYFGHSLGHGVGLEVHEDPRISMKSGVILQEGMVFTVEPGVYFPGQYGVRLEEMVLVTKTGCEVLSDHD